MFAIAIKRRAAICAPNERYNRTFHGTSAWLDAFHRNSNIWAIEFYVNNDISYADVAQFVIFFKLKHSRATIYSQSFTLQPEIVEAICSEIFRIFPAVGTVDFELLLDWDTKTTLTYQVQTKWIRPHYRVLLPGASAEYVDSLDHNQRKKFSYYQRRFFHEFSNASFRFVESTAISDSDVVRLFALCHRRAGKKGFTSVYNQKYMNGIRAMMRSKGILFMITIDDKICAGTIVIKQNDIAYLIAVAHDEKYDKYSLGILSVYMSIKHLASQQIREFNFMGVDFKYKRDFGATPEYRTTILVARNKFYAYIGSRRSNLVTQLVAAIERTVRQFRALVVRTRA